MGSGGRTVGRKLAEKLGVKFFDKWLINELKKRYDLTTEEVERVKGGNGDWWCQLLNAAVAIGQNMGDMSYVPHDPNDEYHLVTTSEMFRAETEILSGIAADTSCVVAGRSGFYVFRQHPNHLSILIQASMPFRVARIMRKQNLSEAEACEVIKKVDKMRENYVKKYTGTSRYDSRNYDLVISADGKTEDQIVDLILEYIG
ncbi:MAG: cytidylate kinase-like family protein [Prevotella sp.]|nr:cytidylate kinase-like family protein [Prevotella sp.]